MSLIVIFGFRRSRWFGEDGGVMFGVAVDIVLFFGIFRFILFVG